MSKSTDHILSGMPNSFQFGQLLTQQMLAILQSQMSAMESVGQNGMPATPPMPEPEVIAELQKELLQAHAELWNSMVSHAQTATAEVPTPSPVVHPSPGDRRFSSPAWQQNSYFNYLHQSYLLNSKFMRSLAEKMPLKDPKAQSRLRFMTEQIIDASSPANFAATNPEFINTALETKGRSISEGISNLLGDIQKGRISTTDETAFEVGKNIATTSGSVIFENELFQLIQYDPLTPKVAKRPLLIVPPCINKFYILDLQPDNSFVRFAVEEGNTVFLISWRNVQADQGHLTWDDYLEDAIIQAIDIVKTIGKVEKINLLGFCVGGTMLSSALCALKARGEDPAASLTLLTTLLDFSESGGLGLFIDKESVEAREASIGQGGLLKGSELETVFSALRPNDLIWNYVTNNYLKGKKPAAFDLLYWNADSTNLPGPLSSWYMRNMYLENNLCVPGKLTTCGEKIDLSKLKMPAFLLATREDHIVPWHGAYLSTQILGGKIQFVLGASGHIAGVINPASKNKRSFWAGGNQKGEADQWLETATEHPGSWWIHWGEWLKTHADGEKPAPTKPGSTKYKVIEPAPGRYVKAKSRVA